MLSLQFGKLLSWILIRIQQEEHAQTFGIDGAVQGARRERMTFTRAHTEHSDRQADIRAFLMDWAVEKLQQQLLLWILLSNCWNKWSTAACVWIFQHGGEVADPG